MEKYAEAAIFQMNDQSIVESGKNTDSKIEYGVDQFFTVHAGGKMRDQNKICNLHQSQTVRVFVKVSLCDHM